MIRIGASRLALRFAAPSARRATSCRVAPPPVQWTTQFSSISSKRPHTRPSAQANPVQAALLRRALSEETKQAESRYAQEKIKPTPETVSSTSSIHPMLGEVGVEAPAQDVDMGKSIKHDLGTVRETFSLTEVPREAYVIGLAGVLPYLATSLSTVYCAWEINHATADYGYLLSAQSATTMLHFLEPLQIGYGAVILSFLSAIHWGLEWAGYGGTQGYKRYAIGVVVPAVAWPTVLMPVEYALITQFMAFTILYYVDTRATYRGWTPAWYAIYRFTLTFIVGASIVVSLIGRGEVADEVKRIPGAVDRAQNLQEGAQQKLSQEEEAIRAENSTKLRDTSGEDSKDENEEEEGNEEGSSSTGNNEGKREGGSDGENDSDKKSDKPEE